VTVMRTTKSAILLLILCWTAGCATRGDLQILERDTLDARKRLVKLEKDMDLVRKTTNEEIQNSLKGFRRDMESMRKGAADLQAAQDNIRVDMREISGKTDDLKVLLQKRADEKSFLKEETERRIAALEERLANLEKKLEELNVGGGKTGETTASPEGLYQSGLSAYKAGDMRKAVAELTRFMERHPKHELVSNAQYWIGEAYYSERNYEQAVLAFQEVIKKYPKKEKAPAALLKQAMSFRGLGDAKSARYVLRKLQEDYPRSEEAKKAKELLLELK